MELICLLKGIGKICPALLEIVWHHLIQLRQGKNVWSLHLIFMYLVRS